VLAVLANVVLVLDVDALGIASGFRALIIPSVAFLLAFDAGGATVFYWLLNRVVSDADRTLVRVAVGVLLLLFVPDGALFAIDPAATSLSVVALTPMHVIVAAMPVRVLRHWEAER